MLNINVASDLYPPNSPSKILNVQYLGFENTTLIFMPNADLN